MADISNTCETFESKHSADLRIIRDLAKKYAEFAFSDNRENTVRKYRDLNSLKRVRPPVLVFEEPWGEFSAVEELKLQCSDPRFHWIENSLRTDLYKLNHHKGDYIVHPYFSCTTALRDSGIGFETNEQIIAGDTGTSIVSHEYEDTLPDDESLEKIKMPVLSVDKKADEINMEFLNSVFSDILPVKKTGVQIYFASWDQIPRYHGVDNSLCDLYDRPEFAHKLIEIFTKINETRLDQYEALNILETDPYYNHCTPACTYELPVKDMDSEKITAKDVWCRAMAQIFAVVSPQMHDEFDLQYTQRFFDRCGLSYYGCCEPLDNKIYLLRQRFKNLRRISITPWANADNAADCIGSDYVLSYKSNPAFVASKNFDAETVIADTKKVLAACRRNNTPCEFILKDISTVKNNPDNISKWVETVNNVIDSEF